MIARMLLPSLGGAPSVWNTCLVFFQATLLAGYYYARVTTRSLTPRGQIGLHAAVLVLAALAGPIGIRTLGGSFDGSFTGFSTSSFSGIFASSHPVLWLIAMLALGVGAPFLALAATTPLIQSWFGLDEAADPYRLYSASNVGSLAGLLSYPFLVEPLLGLDTQVRLWAFGYALAAILVASCAALAWDAERSGTGIGIRNSGFGIRKPLFRVGSSISLERLRWAALAFVPASLTLSVTTYISTDIAAIPLVWILPLSLYLISIAAAFARPRIPRGTRLLLPVIVLAPFVCVLIEATRPGVLQIPVHLGAFFFVSLACHQALASRRPARERLP